MAAASKFAAGLFFGLAILSFTGCAALCKNFGCASCGPIAVAGCGDCGSCDNCDSCGGCDECGGCGELYVDPWINHPADCCDPCDTCGNYNGQSCGSCRPLFAGIGTLWGYRNPACPPCDGCHLSAGCDSCGLADCEGCCEAGCGCDSCAGEIISEGDVQVIGEPIYRDEPIYQDEPIYRDAPVEVVPHQPTTTKKIFRPRPQMARRHGS